MNARKTIAISALGALLSANTFLPAATAAPESKSRPQMDVAFCIDTTGSMQPEIDNVKAKVKELVSKLSGGKPAPIIRVGLVAYRDRGDQYVTKVFPFTENIDEMVKDISQLQAAGGGDGPEAVNQGLHSAVSDLQWDKNKKTAKILFLIGDAGPHYYPNDYNWQDESKRAISKGIQINTIGCNGLQSYRPQDGIEVFQQIAKLTDGAFEPLAYKQVVRTAAGTSETRITSAAGDFSMKAGRKADWREGITNLSMRGELAKSAAPAMAGGMLAKPMAAPAGMAGRGYASDETSVGGGMKGSENNLDAIMLQAAEKKAKQALNVDYK
jgi:hypothetical protein